MLEHFPIKMLIDFLVVKNNGKQKRETESERAIEHVFPVAFVERKENEQ